MSLAGLSVWLLVAGGHARFHFEDCICFDFGLIFCVKCVSCIFDLVRSVFTGLVPKRGPVFGPTFWGRLY